jgi:hypothetical protein
MAGREKRQKPIQVTEFAAIPSESNELAWRLPVKDRFVFDIRKLILLRQIDWG